MEKWGGHCDVRVYSLVSGCKYSRSPQPKLGTESLNLIMQKMLRNRCEICVMTAGFWIKWFMVWNWTTNSFLWRWCNARHTCVALILRDEEQVSATSHKDQSLCASQTSSAARGSRGGTREGGGGSTTATSQSFFPLFFCIQTLNMNHFNKRIRVESWS